MALWMESSSTSSLSGINSWRFRFVLKNSSLPVVWVETQGSLGHNSEPVLLGKTFGNLDFWLLKTSSPSFGRKLIEVQVGL